MQKIFFSLFLGCIALQIQAQTQRKITANLLMQYNSTIYDVTTVINPWGIGIGLQLFYNSKSAVKPTIDLSGDIYLSHSNIGILGPDNKIIDGVEKMTNLFAGVAYQHSKNLYLCLTAGPGIINGKTLFGIKPSVGFYFTQKQRGTFRVSYINLFNRYPLTKNDFGTISFALGFKLF